MDEPLQEFQPGDVVEVSIPIEHSANLKAVVASFVREETSQDIRFDMKAQLSAGEEPSTTVATFTIPIAPEADRRGECRMMNLVVDTAGGLHNVRVDDAPDIRFKIIPERYDHLRANGFDMRVT